MMYDMPPAPHYVCNGCTAAEVRTVEFLQGRGIKDKYALATVMGNIRQESGFHANICEGGARVAYNKCFSGGYGIIQWTTPNRYYGLGKFCTKYKCDPSTLDGQLRYMVSEIQWQKAVTVFKTPNQSISTYMNAAYGWLGWGIHGNRTHFAIQYLNKLKLHQPA